MDYCGPTGTPHSFFLGGPHRWTQADRDKALAWQERQRQIHPPCGTHPHDWDESHGGSRDAWEFEVAICPGCARREKAIEEMNAPANKAARGKYIRIRRPRPAKKQTGGKP